MFCAVYKSPKRPDTYLYVETKDDFSRVDNELLAHFGPPSFVLVCNLAKRSKLGIADIEKVRESLQRDGFYLQLPPQNDDWIRAALAD